MAKKVVIGLLGIAVAVTIIINLAAYRGSGSTTDESPR